MTASLPFTAEDLAAHADSLRRLARDLLADDELARDAVQDAFVTALERPPRTGTALLAWLRRVVRHGALDLRRGEGRRRRRERLAARSEGVDPRTQLALQDDILEAVRGLREPYRTAVWLRYYEDRSPAEIGALLGEPVRTVKTRLHRALPMLRERLDRGRGGREAWTRALLPLVAGGVMQAKRVALAVAGIAMIAGVWVFWPEGKASIGGREDGTTPARSVTADADGTHAGTEPDRRAVAAESVPAKNEAEPYGALLVRASWHDGSPAADVAFLLTAENEPLLDRGETRIVTDGNGIARAERLRAGALALRSERGGEAKAEVVAGQEAEVQFGVPRGVDVEGEVVDGADHAVTGAQIWLATGRSDWLGGRVVGVSDAEGRFRIRSLNRRHSLGALASGFAPSTLVDLEGLASAGTAAVGTVRLHVTRREAVVAGQVLDQRAQPIPGALVAVGSGREAGHRDLRSLERWSPRVATTDVEGRFRCESVEPGTIPLAARASGFGSWSGQVECPTGATASITITLLRGVTVKGMVRDEQGKAVAAAEVLSVSEPGVKAELKFARSDLLRRGMAFPRPRTCSDAEGRYCLHDVPPGETTLLAGKWERASFPGLGYRGSEQITLQAAPGEGLAWDPVLSKGLQIRGRLVAADGTPYLAERSLVLFAVPDRPAEGAGLVFTYVQRDGAFVFDDCVDVPYTVHLEWREQTAPWVYRTGVRPTPNEIVMQVPAKAPPQPPATITGRVVDDGRRFEGEMDVSLFSGSEMRNARIKGDRFSFADVPPGRYQLLLLAKDEIVHAGAEFVVEPGQRHDAGDLVTPPRARVSIALRPPPGVELGSPTGRLGSGVASRALRWDGQRLRVENLSPGSYRVQVRGQGWASRPRDLEVAPLQDLDIAIDLVPAVRRTLEITLPPPDLWRNGKLVLRDAGGEAVAEYDGMYAAAVGMRPLTWNASQPLGVYTLEASTDGGHTRSWPVDLRDPATAKSVLRFSLR